MKNYPKLYRTVLLPIQTPNDNFCFGGVACCTYFNNEGGWDRCELHIDSSLYNDTEGRVPKPITCRNLLYKEGKYER